MEADCDGVREPLRERAEAGERARRRVLVEEPDRRCGLGFRIGGGGARRGGELSLRRDGPVEALQRDAVEDSRPRPPRARVRAEPPELLCG